MRTVYKHVFYYDGTYKRLECQIESSPKGWGNRAIYYVEPDGTERSTFKHRLGKVTSASMQKSYHVILDTDDARTAFLMVRDYLLGKIEEFEEKVDFYMGVYDSIAMCPHTRSTIEKLEGGENTPRMRLVVECMHGGVDIEDPPDCVGKFEEGCPLLAKKPTC